MRDKVQTGFAKQDTRTHGKPEKFSQSEPQLIGNGDAWTLDVFLPAGLDTAGNLSDALSFGHVSFVVGYFPEFLYFIAAVW